MSAGKRKVNAPTRRISTVSTSIDIRGLEGQVEVTSHADETPEGFTHRIVYRSIIGEERLTFDFTATLLAEPHRYELAENSQDALSPDGKQWRHPGQTPTGSARKQEGRANVPTKYREGGSRLQYVVSADHPFSEPYTGLVLQVPFT